MSAEQNEMSYEQALPPIPEGHPHAEALDAVRFELVWAERVVYLVDANTEERAMRVTRTAQLRASYDVLLAVGGV